MSDHPLSSISSDALRQAADIRDQIETLQANLEAILSGSATAKLKKKPGRPKGSGNKIGAKPKAAKRKGGKRKISPEGLERIRAAQRARWAKVKKGK